MSKRLSKIKNSKTQCYWSLVTNINPIFGGNYMCEVTLHNKEIMQNLTCIITKFTVISIQKAMYSNAAKRLHK